MEDYLGLILKCIVVYFVMIIALRVMGKREVGELSVFDIVIYLVMSELLAITISEDGSIFKSLVAITTLVILQIVIAYIIMKSRTFRNIFDGKNDILIHNGYVFQERMKKNRYNIDDLMSQIRESNLSSIDEVAFAILENNGTLSILKKKDCKLIYPDPIIYDGEINQEALDCCHITKKDLMKMLRKKHFKNEKQVFIALLKKDGLFVVEKQLS